MDRTSIALVAGGRSPEHEVSILSGMEVAKHLDPNRYRFLPIHVDRDGIWHVAQRFVEEAHEIPPLLRSSASLTLGPGSAVELCREKRVDCFFLALHGPYGEDGTVQGMLDLYRMPYTGSGVGASAVAMDKIRCREALSQHGIPMARALTPTPRLTDRDAESVLPDVERTLGFPCFLKSDRSGSSIGVARADSRAEFLPALEQIRPHGERWLVEEALSGTELTVACLGNTGGEVQALPPVEIRPRHDRFFTYRAKYTSDESDEIGPPRSVPAPLVEEAMDLGRTCHEALCCDGMSRTDMILTDDGAKVLEVNTIPGLTRMSLLPKAAAAAGISFARLVDRLISLALARAGREDLRAAS